MLADTNVTKTVQVKNFITALIQVQNNLRLYVSGNRAIDQTTGRLLELLTHLLAEEETLTIFVGQHALIYEEQFLDRSNIHFDSFANRLYNHGIVALTFHRGVTAEQLHAFLNLVGLKPAKTWEEGGIAAALCRLDVTHITAREMSELDFTLDDEEVDDGESLLQGSPLWERFAMSIIHGLHAGGGGEGGEELTATVLARMANRILAESEGDKDEELAKDLSRFLLSLKHEKVRIYRTAAFNSLVEFVNSLAPHVRNLFFKNVFNLNVEAELSERLLRGMSDQVILDALKNASMERGYAPPVVMQLLGRLAEERGLVTRPPAVSAADQAVAEERIGELFRADDFNKYVPAPYQDALLSIMKNHQLPLAVTENLTRLKQTLEQQWIEQHVGAIFMQILKGPVDSSELGLIKGNLKETVSLYLASHDYVKVRELLAICRSEHLWGEVSSELDDYFASDGFSIPLLADLPRIDREGDAAGMALLADIGPPIIGPLLDRLSLENNRSLRRLYLNVLGRLGKECVPQALNRLDDSRWFVVRNMLYLLREFGDASVLPQVRQCMHYPNPKVSQEALKTCLFFRDRDAVPHLLKFLGSGNEAEVLVAVSQAAYSADPVITAKLVAMLHEGNMLGFNLDLKKSIVRSLASAVGKKAVPIFAELLHSRNFFHPRLHEELQLEVIAMLEKIAGDEAKRLLAEQVEHGSPELARAAQVVLARARGGKS